MSEKEIEKAVDKMAEQDVNQLDLSTPAPEGLPVLKFNFVESEDIWGEDAVDFELVDASGVTILPFSGVSQIHLEDARDIIAKKDQYTGIAITGVLPEVEED